MEMPLAMMEPGKTVVIRKVTGRDEIRQRLAELGFVVIYRGFRVIWLEAQDMTL